VFDLCSLPYTAYWSGIVMGAEQRQMDSHKKMVIAIAIASTSLGAVILSVLCIWIYHTKYPSKSKGKNVQRSGFFSFFSQFHFSKSHEIWFG